MRVSVWTKNSKITHCIIYSLASFPLLIIFSKILNINFTIKFYILSSLPLIINFYVSWVILIMAFIVKLPLFFIHMWLPKAHVMSFILHMLILITIEVVLISTLKLKYSWTINIENVLIITFFCSELLSIDRFYLYSIKKYNIRFFKFFNGSTVYMSCYNNKFSKL